LADFLPGTAGWSSLRTLLWFALDDAFAIELALLPVADPGNAARLGRDAPRLAWTAWLGAGTPAPVLLRLPARPVAS
jgi:predicted component of type VI protein secretion system